MKRLISTMIFVLLAMTGNANAYLDGLGKMKDKATDFIDGVVSQSRAVEGTGTGKISVWFSPNGGCTMAIVNEVRAAKSQILVQAYSFTSRPIAEALIDAHKRGVKIIAVLDKSQRKEKYTSATFLKHANIPVYIDSEHAIAHNKIMVIDNRTIVTGSFNFTSSAEYKNAENLILIKDDPALIKAYTDNFNKHKDHSSQY